ncbi:MAG: hypothetical protein Q8Q33_05200 [Chlamydiota bacterium]|nr:hypothetical protein [Chlamydiota bacterium]
MAKDNPKKNIARFQLCGAQGCCPVVEVCHDSNEVIIHDDYQGKVTLTKEQWREAVSKVKVE